MKYLRIVGINFEDISKIVQHFNNEHYKINYKMISLKYIKKRKFCNYGLIISFVYEADYNRFMFEIGGDFKQFCRNFFLEIYNEKRGIKNG